jgi:ferrous iron transport protein A
MPDIKEIPLNRMEAGQSGRVTQIQGGRGFINRLSSLGIRPGQNITKISAMFMKGPVTVQIGNAQVAVGFGMARRIMVRPDR